MKKKNLSIKIKIFIVLNILNILVFNNFLKNVSLIMPKVSVFLPIYNKEVYITRSIMSVQKQTLNDIEIIAVNDFSTDKTLKTLKNLSKKDKRIKVINNDRNHGLLYSRAMGIINCSGQFVMNLDPDDQISNENNLKILYYKSIEFSSDVITFLLKKIKRKNITYYNEEIKKLSYNNYKSNKKKQKFEYPIITNKFIKKDIALKAYNFFKQKIYGNKWNYHEDNIWNILIQNYTKSNIYLNRYIYLYLLNNESLMKNKKNSLEIKNHIYRFEMAEKMYNNDINETLNYLISLFYIANKYFKKIINKDIEIKKKIFHFKIKYNNYFYNNSKTSKMKFTKKL